MRTHTLAEGLALKARLHGIAGRTRMYVPTEIPARPRRSCLELQTFSKRFLWLMIPFSVFPSIVTWGELLTGLGFQLSPKYGNWLRDALIHHVVRCQMLRLTFLCVFFVRSRYKVETGAWSSLLWCGRLVVVRHECRLPCKERGCSASFGSICGMYSSQWIAIGRCRTQAQSNAEKFESGAGRSDEGNKFLANA